ncbi:MAG: hypothetical protein GXO23_04380 [Crenarchaeota archaeon]|nr:hypothetical protein [Thermoproteota archaeon]
MSIENIDVTSPRLLVLTRRDPTCIFFSLFITSLRLSRGKLTHVSVVDYLFEPIIEDLLQHYDNVLMLDICDEFNIANMSRKAVSKMSIDLKVLVDSRELIKSGGQNVETFLDISTVLYLLEHPEHVLDVGYLTIESLEKIDRPCLPGSTYLNVNDSIRLSLAPYIPEITGSENIKIDATDVESLLKLMGEKLLKNRFSGILLDTLLYSSYSVRGGALVQDLMLILESHFWKDEYINIIDTAKLENPLLDKRLYNTCLEYVKNISNIIQKILKSRDYATDVDNMVSFYRLCKILRFHRKWREMKITCRPRRGVICSASGSNIEVSSREYSLLSKDGIHVVCYEE